MRVIVNGIEVDGWTDGWPHWVCLRQGDRMLQFDHEDAKLIAHALLHHARLMDAQDEHLKSMCGSGK